MSEARRGVGLFRPEALERLAAPEQLDRAIVVAGPSAWVALVGLGCILAAALIWGVAGTIATRVPAQGILITVGGRVADALTPAEGVLRPAEGVIVGSVVQAGQVIAVLELPQSDRRRQDAREAATEWEAELTRRAAALDRARQAREVNRASRLVALEEQLRAAQDRVQALTVMLRGQEVLARSGNTTEDRYQNLRERHAAARQAMADARAGIAALDSEELAAQAAAERELAELAQRVAEARRIAAQQDLALEESRTVIAPVGGRLLEWKASLGARVGPGVTVASIETGGRGLEALLFVAPDRGKQVQPGMAVLIEPGGFRREEWGTLVGTVTVVSDYPVTRLGMLSVIQNDKLVEQFSQGGAPFAVHVALRPDSGNPTGYAWSAGEGPAGALSSGMPANGHIAVRQQRPISLVLPFLRRVSGA